MTIMHIHGRDIDMWDVELGNEVAVEHDLAEAISRCLNPQRSLTITTQQGGAKLENGKWHYGQN